MIIDFWAYDLFLLLDGLRCCLNGLKVRGVVVWGTLVMSGGRSFSPSLGTPIGRSFLLASFETLFESSNYN